MNYKIYKNNELVIETPSNSVAWDYLEIKKDTLCKDDILTIKYDNEIIAECIGTSKEEKIGLQLHNSEQVEQLCVVRLNEFNFPLAFKEKVDEFMEQGMYKTRTDAENAVRGMEIELELYYHKNNGLFAIEEDVVGNGVVYSPYDATKCINPIDE